MTETKGSMDISTRLQRIAKMAREHPEWVLTTLAHHIDIDWLKNAYRLTPKNKATGVDRQTGADYASDLDANLDDLLERFKSGLYRAPPVRRVYIPKGNGQGERPIGIPTFEDKVLQRSVTMVLNAVYEQDFLDCSYGFRPGRSQHQALTALRDWMMDEGVGWVLDVDIQGFFDSLDHTHLRGFLDQRVADGVIRRVIHKWLKAGVMEDGQWQRGRDGTPQGGVISPLLANVYLHEVIDVWFEREVKPRLRGRAFMVRFADDIVMAFTHKDDAHRVREVLPKRLGRYGLTLHPNKTRLVPFRRPRRDDDQDGRLPGSFDFLGFTHYWARSRRGKWVIKQKTARDRLSRALRRVNELCRGMRHRPIPGQQRSLNARLRGHYNYYGITGNYFALRMYYHGVQRLWLKWLQRRSHRGHRTWRWFHALQERLPLLQPRAVHSTYPPSLAKP